MPNSYFIQILMAENVSYSCLVGAAVYSHGNDAKTFVEQARLSGMSTMYVTYLEENGLAESVPRMEAHYLNPSPWAEKEVYEIEFNDILKQVRLAKDKACPTTSHIRLRLEIYQGCNK